MPGLVLTLAASAALAAGTGGDPVSTVTAAHTSPVGRTMPPADPAAHPVVDPTERMQCQKDLDRVLDSNGATCR